MSGNIITFPAKAARTAGSSAKAKAAASASPIVRMTLKEIETLPKEEKRLIAAEIERRISARMAGASTDISLKKQRDARYKAWGEVDARASFWKALDDFQQALHVAQRQKMPEALQYDPVELDSASWHAHRHAYRDAIDRQLLMPAPNMGAVLWKQRQKFSRLSRDRIERAIADDLAWLKRYPASERRVRRTPE